MRVCVCHCAALPRPVRSWNGKSPPGGSGSRPRLLEDEPGAAVRVVEPAVGEEPPLRSEVGVRGRVRPLDAAGLVEHVVVGDAGDVARHAGRELLEDLEDRLGRLPLGRTSSRSRSSGRRA